MYVKRLFVYSHRILSLVSFFFFLVSFLDMLEIPLMMVTIHDLTKTFRNQSNSLSGMEKRVNDRDI